MLEGNCHCGQAGWTLASAPESATACNCSVCRRYGLHWTAVDLRLAEPARVADLPIDHFDGPNTFDDLSRDHR